MTKKLILIMVAAIIVTAFVAQGSFAKGTEGLNSTGKSIEEKTPNQTKCPVMGGDISKKSFLDHKGKRIYFCCPGCDKTFLKDPEKYLKKMKDEGVILENAPEKEKKG